MKIKNDQLNFAVGPVPMSDDILAVGSEPIPYFRTSDFSALMKENEALVKKFFGADDDARAVFLTGSGTAAMEAAVINLFGSDDRLLVVNGGSFGHRFCEICDAYSINYEDIKIEPGQVLKKKQLDKYEGRGYTGMLVNLGETSTGVLYDLGMISDFCKRNGMHLIVDTVSSFIADEINMKDSGADIVLTGSQKALAVAPGISVVVMSGDAVKRIYANNPKCYYLDLKKALKDGERGQTPFTPAIGTLIQLNRRLCEMNSTGIEHERAKIREVANDFRKRIANYPFTFFAEEKSYAVTSVTPTGTSVTARQLFDILKAEYNIILCPNGGELADKVIRIGHIGYHTIKDNDRLFAALDDLKKRGIL